MVWGRPDAGAVDRAARAEQARDAVAVHELEDVAGEVEAIVASAGDAELLTVARALTALGRAQVFRCTRASMRAGADSYQRAADAFRRTGEHSWLAETLARRGYTALFLEGHMAEGADELRAALALLPAGDVTRGIWLANYADVLDTVGRVPEADAAVAEVLEIGRRFRHAGLSGMGWWSASWIASRRGDRSGTEHALGALQADLDRWARPGQVVEVFASAAECWARLGDEARSRDELARARDVATEVGYEGPWAIAAARHAALFGDPADAVERLDRLAPEGVEGVIPAGEPSRQVQRALAEARMGNRERAAELVDEARATSARFGVPDLVDRLEAEALRRLDGLLDHDATVGEAPREAPVSSTVVTLLGGFTVRVGGRDRTPHPGYPSLLVKLLALKGAMTTDAAIDALWPDVDITTGRSRLRNLLNRLRSRAGDVVVRDGDLLRLRTDVTTDVDSFDAQAAEALQAADAEQVGLARLALALYTGQLLPGDLYEDWAAGPRERLERRYLALVDLVASDAIARGETDEALRLLDEAIAAEPLDQHRYQVACEVLVASGRVGSARTMARRAAAALEEIGVALAPELAELAAHA
jgi:DNA-binding SARP family transcriptional activator